MEFRKVTGHDLPTLLSEVYDNKGRTRIIVTGSQVGVLEDFLKPDDSKALLFGRKGGRVRIPRLSREEFIGFLETGFAQTGVDTEPWILELASERLDGVIGWLTFFGASRSISVEQTRML